MNNRWNRVIYKLWSPIYDKFFNTGQFLRARKKIFNNAPFQDGQNVLFVGIGTGADLAFVNHEKLKITAIDISPDMLNQAMTKYKDSTIHFLEMDAQNLMFKDNTFDVIVASLILSVVPDANRCFSEMKRVLKPNGQIMIFDKFAKRKDAWLKRLIRPIIRLFGTDIGLSFDKIFNHHDSGLEIIEDQPVLMSGMYRKIIIQKRFLTVWRETFMKRYKSLLFDVDDTLLDFGATEQKALRALFDEIQFDFLPEAEERYRTINRALWQSFEEGKIGRDEVLNTRFSLFLKEYGREEDGSALETKYRSYIANGHDLVDGAFELITELHQNYDLYIVTNGVSDTQYKRLTDAGLLPFFKKVFVSEETGYQKPMKEFFDYVFERISDFSAEKGLIIGDSLTADIKGGHLSGLDTCWFNPAKIENRTGISPKYEIGHLSELKGILME